MAKRTPRRESELWPYVVLAMVRTATFSSCRDIMQMT